MNESIRRECLAYLESALALLDRAGPATGVEAAHLQLVIDLIADRAGQCDAAVRVAG